MRSVLHRTRRGERGASSAELAAMLPVLLLATIGLIDFGRIVSTRNMLSNAAREATRYASVRSIDSEDPVTTEMVREQVMSNLGLLDPEFVTITTTWLPTNAPGNSVQVNVDYDFVPIAPLMPMELLAVNASSTMIISY